MRKNRENIAVLNDFQSEYGTMRLGLVYTQTFHKPAVLLWSKRLCFAFLPWPLEAAGLQPLVQQYEAIAFPVQCLDAVSASAAEQEQCIGEWIQIELLLNKSCQSVYSTAKICVTAGNVHPVGTIKVCQHDFKIRSTVSTVAASAPEWMSASAPEIRTVTATLME